ncbi:hypothetical protein KOW79_006817 [Hemibagrus wyckioides]|uniref:TRIM8/14/16/25/29/45/65 coiled-coil region domain-containing protein n=1 Tax=Hemibagrus wyckioides TaxID=337641 RepID=A0A9D3NXD0_9TELE|nr:hypothetical protein KOW79_006817 [Hemibagrus wyckioides]
MYRESQQRIKYRENKLEELRKAVRSHKCSAQAAIEESDRIFTELIKSIVKTHHEATALIRAQEKAAVSRAEGVMKQLEQEMVELKRRNAELEELLYTDDPVQFLQIFQFASAPLVSSDVPTIVLNSSHPFNSVVQSVSQLKEKLEESCKEDFENISSQVTDVQIVLSDEQKTREEFLRYFCLWEERLTSIPQIHSISSMIHPHPPGSGRLPPIAETRGEKKKLEKKKDRVREKNQLLT